MWDFFKEGGWGMWAILFVGLGLLAATGRFAWKPDPRRLGFIGGLTLSTAFAVLYALSTDLGTVFGAVAGMEKLEGDQRVRILLQGLKESSRPVTFGATILTVAALLFTAGMARMSAPAGGEREQA